MMLCAVLFPLSAILIIEMKPCWEFLTFICHSSEFCQIAEDFFPRLHRCRSNLASLLIVRLQCYVRTVPYEGDNFANYKMDNFSLIFKTS